VTRPTGRRNNVVGAIIPKSASLVVVHIVFAGQGTLAAKHETAPLRKGDVGHEVIFEQTFGRDGNGEWRKVKLTLV
jgi:hypothetical protein